MAASEMRQGQGEPAIVFLPSGSSLTSSQLQARATATAHWLIESGMQPGDTLAAILENRAELIVLARAARRAGLYFTPLSVHLQEREVSFMLQDCGARVLVISAQTADLALRVTAEAGSGIAGNIALFSVDEGVHGLPTVARAVAGRPTQDEALPPRPVGRDQLYSSGTTGMPRAIRKPMNTWESRHQEDGEVAAWRKAFGFDAQSIYFSAAPLYHAAPLRYVLRTLDVGGRCVVQERFEPAQALQALRDWGVTHSQWVPTMFIRMLALPLSVRTELAPTGMRVAIHSAAPCPRHVKQAMIAWWGPILHEYYAGTEGVGMTAIDSREWLQRPGSVGTARVGEIRIVGETGELLGPGEIGQVYFAGGPGFEYLNDPDKTVSVRNAQGWATYGDIGHVDADGYLYLSDRRADLIISGGVNVYPQEVEDVLLTHPDIEDAAVIGVPDADLGETVMAIVKLRNPSMPTAQRGELAHALIAYCRERMSHVKAPRSVNFEATLPRMENGKLMRRRLKERFRSTLE
jgi:long-chain acyl-CoA synthetase